MCHFCDKRRHLCILSKFKSKLNDQLLYLIIDILKRYLIGFQNLALVSISVKPAENTVYFKFTTK